MTEIRMISPDDNYLLSCKMRIAVNRPGVICKKLNYFLHDLKFNDKTK